MLRGAKKLLMILALGPALCQLLNSCGQFSLFGDFVEKTDNRQFETSNPAFASYVQSFESYGKAHLKDFTFSVGDIPINFGNTEKSDRVGVCFKYPGGKREVIIKQSWWDSADEKSRESLVFHEYGHCRLNRKHRNEKLSDNNRQVLYKSSLMSENIVSGHNYNKFESGYAYELFTQDTSLMVRSISNESNL